jgi:hypothetical protein
MAPKGRRIRVPRGPAPDVQRPNITSGVRGLQHLSAGTRVAVGAGSVAWIRRGVATREVSRGFARKSRTIEIEASGEGVKKLPAEVEMWTRNSRG